MKEKILQFIGIFTLFFVVFTLSIGGIFIYGEDLVQAIRRRDISAEQIELKEDKINKKDVKKEVEDKRTNILLLGIDALNGNYENNRSRTDTIMLLSVDPKTKSSFILSIPRDSRVDIPGRKNKDKINHAHAYGGPDLTVRTVESLLGINIDYYVRADYRALFKLVDDVGGVEIDVPMNMVYSDPYATPPLYINIKKGKQVLDGEKSMQYLRFRKGYSNQDIGRTHAQQVFMKELANKMMSPSSIIHIPKYIRTINEYTDTNMDLQGMLSLATSAVSFIRPSEIENATLEGTPVSIGGVSYYEIDENKKKELLEYLLSGEYKNKEDALIIEEENKQYENKDENNNENNNEKDKKNEVKENSKTSETFSMMDYSEEDAKNKKEETKKPNVAVLNGSGISGRAVRTADLVRIIGYPVISTGNAETFDYDETIIYHREGFLEDARRIREILGGGRVLQENKTHRGRNVDILVIAGKKMKN